jgi:hypothetical protein
MSAAWWLAICLLTVLPPAAVVIGFVRRDWAEAAFVGALVIYLVIGVIVYSAATGDNTGHACIRENQAGRCTAFEDVPRRNDPGEVGDSTAQDRP